MKNIPATPALTAENAKKFPQALAPGPVLSGRYVVDLALGQGGFGITYKALDYETGNIVAIKEFLPTTLAFHKNRLSPKIHNAMHKEDFNTGKTHFLLPPFTTTAEISAAKRLSQKGQPFS